MAVSTLDKSLFVPGFSELLISGNVSETRMELYTGR